MLFRFAWLSILLCWPKIITSYWHGLLCLPSPCSTQHEDETGEMLTGRLEDVLENPGAQLWGMGSGFLTSSRAQLRMDDSGAAQHRSVPFPWDHKETSTSPCPLLGSAGGEFDPHTGTTLSVAPHISG